MRCAKGTCRSKDTKILGTDQTYFYYFCKSCNTTFKIEKAIPLSAHTEVKDGENPVLR